MPLPAVYTSVSKCIKQLKKIYKKLVLLDACEKELTGYAVEHERLAYLLNFEPCVYNTCSVNQDIYAQWNTTQK